MKSASTQHRALSAFIACRPGIRGLGRRLRSVDRAVDFVVWEHDTLLPKYGINLGVEYTHTFGVGEIHDYEWFFGSSPRIVRNLIMAKALGVDMGKEIVYFPRRSFDIWNTRYFVIPFDARGWRDPSRGYASFLFETERIYPQPKCGRGPDDAEALKNWVINQDFQILRNLNEFPRAWVVHQARWLDPPLRLSPRRRRRRNSGDPLRRRPSLA